MVQPYPPILPRHITQHAVKMALEEDLGRAGDVTSYATIAPGKQAEANFVAREDATICGLDLVAEAFHAVGEDSVSFKPNLKDGDKVSKGDIIGVAKGDARTVLSGERVALNYFGHMTSIASYTAQFAAEISHTNAEVTCTRKTTPGLRALEKYAVRVGGGSNHRYGLDDAMMIKDNHIAVAGGVAEAIEAARAFAGHMMALEVEVDTLEQFEIALQYAPNVILLDNMSNEQLSKAVEINAGKVVLEASGGVRLETIKAIAETGVNYISTSKITVGAPPIDIGLDIEID